MQLISKYNKGLRFLLYFIVTFSKHAWVVPLKDKKGATIVNAFQSILDDSGRKLNKIRVDQGSVFYNRSLRKWFDDNDIGMYSTHNEGKSAVAERFFRTLKNKIYKHMKAVSKNFYFDVLDDIVDKYNNTYHTTIRMKPIDVKSGSYAEYSADSNVKDAKFEIDDHVRISKYKNIYAKGHTLNWSEEVFVISKVKNTVPCAMIPTVKKSVERSMKNNCRKQIKQNLELKKQSREKVIGYMSNGKAMIICLIAGLIKRT